MNSSSFVNFCNRAISLCFYLLFFLVPFVMAPNTFELFEFNKMWLVFGFSLLIGFFWISKMVFEGKVEVRRTPLDIPIALFLLGQIISTIFSLDRHVSIWGYYGRFNGGLFSIISYIFLYYAFASNVLARGGDLGSRDGHMFDRTRAKARERKFGNASEDESPIKSATRFLKIILISGAIVALWGLPSHFGYDPTCLVFRGTLDVSCWTEAFQPRVRIFSTLGQPNWLAAYLAILLPISIAYSITYFNNLVGPSTKNQKYRNFLFTILFLIFNILLYLDLIYTRSQSGFIGFWTGLLAFIALYIYVNRKENTSIFNLFKKTSTKFLIFFILIFLIVNFFAGFPVARLNAFSLGGIKTKLSKQELPAKSPPTQQTQTSVIELGGTDSSKIRLIVWRGALDVARRNPLFGTGPETFAFSYYKVKPKEHNLTSEWDYLYNKAHNEYLNYLATTGVFGLGSYLLLIGWFLVSAIKRSRAQSFDNKNELLNHDSLLNSALIGTYVTILVSNFFGFSVVITNLFFFFIPLFFYGQTLSFPLLSIPKSKSSKNKEKIAGGGFILIGVTAIIILYLEFVLVRFWFADREYSLGYNLARSGEHVQANAALTRAVGLRPGETIFKDQLSVNLVTLALAYFDQNLTTDSAKLASEAKKLSDEVVGESPNNVVFYRTRTKVLFGLAQIEPKYFKDTIEAINRAHELAPTDAKILYNIGLLYNEKSERERAIDALRQAVSLKPNYIDPYYAIALIYIQMAEDSPTRSLEYREKARQNLTFILKSIDPENKTIRELLKTLE